MRVQSLSRFLLVVLSLFALACSGTQDGTGGDTTPTDTDVTDTADTEPDLAGCGAGPACEQGLICFQGECIECLRDDNCGEGYLCQDRVCVEKPCETPCDVGWHCKEGACVVDVCDPACEPGFHCEVDECVADPCVPECEDGFSCIEGACIEDDCEPEGCPKDKHCSKGECVDNECAEDCEAKSCVCLVSGECGECQGCTNPDTGEPGCPKGFTCDDTGTCVPNDCGEPGCSKYQWCDTTGCVDNVCEPACQDLACGCLVDGGTDLDCECICVPECGEGEWCDPADLTCHDLPCAEPCGADQHCEKGQCVATTCQPECPQGARCVWSEVKQSGECVDWTNCLPSCADYEYCDDGTCTAYQCPEGCSQTEHCVEGGICVENQCDTTCPPGTFCNKDQECEPECSCINVPSSPICGLVDNAGGSAFMVFDNQCELNCAGAVPANCATRPTQPVCDVASYLLDPEGNHTYDNVCFAACEGVDVDQIQGGQCSCAMTCDEEDLGDNPVCGEDCNNYENPCALSCAGEVIRYPGLCQSGCGLCYPCDEEAFLDPVCGNDGTSYVSLCELTNCYPEATTLAMDYPGECVGDTGAPCEATPLPVCGARPGTSDYPWMTYANQCVANYVGVDIYFDWACTSCDPRPDTPVCGYAPFGSLGWQNIRNACVAGSLGYFSKVYPGICVHCTEAPGADVNGYCDLTTGTPVCGTDGVTYANACAAYCAGATKDYDGACTCPTVYEPVCGKSVLSPGKQYTYGNECVAKSVYGVTQFTAGECPLCVAACTGEAPDPICGLDGVSYPHVCAQLKCNGDNVVLGLADKDCNGTCPCM